MAETGQTAAGKRVHRRQRTAEGGKRPVERRRAVHMRGSGRQGRHEQGRVASHCQTARLECESAAAKALGQFQSVAIVCLKISFFFRVFMCDVDSSINVILKKNHKK